MDNYPKPYYYNIYYGFFNGFWYNVVMFNQTFKFWVERKLNRKELKPVALNFIGPDIYELNDIESVKIIHNM